MSGSFAQIGSQFPKLMEWVQQQPETTEPEAEPTHRETWADKLARCRVPKAYAEIPESLPIPSGLVGWFDSHWSLSLLGPTGCGKTWLAVRILLDLSTLSRQGRFADASLSVAQIKREFGLGNQGETFDRLCSVPILLLDDLGAERGTDYQSEQLALILRARYNDALATIITSNAAKIDDVVEPRIASRLANGVFPVRGKDRRL